MKLCEVREKIDLLKSEYRVQLTNIYAIDFESDKEVECYENDKNIVFVIEEPFRKRVFFCATDMDTIKELFDQVPQNAVLEFMYRKENDSKKEIFESLGFSEYTTYVRDTKVYGDMSPFEYPERGRRKILEKKYDPDFGEYPTKEDAKELFELNKKAFDEICDDIFTVEQWETIIENKECLVFRAKGRIVAYHVWKHEGKKMYSNISYCEGPANWNYNLERRVFEKLWEQGVRTQYYWYNVNNPHALTREREEIVDILKARSFMYNGIYVKK